jgi:ABC-type multidrug transport system ATPase subunit
MAPPLAPVISLQNLSKRFGSQVAVDKLSFDVPAGQIVGFLGPNGAGKSTFRAAVARRCHSRCPMKRPKLSVAV